MPDDPAQNMHTHIFWNQISLVHIFNEECDGDIFLTKKFTSSLCSLELAFANCYYLFFRQDQQTKKSIAFVHLVFLQWQNRTIKKGATFVLLTPAYPSGLFSVPQSVACTPASNCVIFPWYLNT